MLCSKLHCQKGFNLIIFSYNSRGQTGSLFGAAQGEVRLESYKEQKRRLESNKEEEEGSTWMMDSEFNIDRQFSLNKKAAQQVGEDALTLPVKNMMRSETHCQKVLIFWSGGRPVAFLALPAWQRTSLHSILFTSNIQKIG